MHGLYDRFKAQPHDFRIKSKPQGLSNFHLHSPTPSFPLTLLQKPELHLQAPGSLAILLSKSTPSSSHMPKSSVILCDLFSVPHKQTHCRAVVSPEHTGRCRLWILVALICSGFSLIFSHQHMGQKAKPESTFRACCSHHQESLVFPQLSSFSQNGDNNSCYLVELLGF